MPVHLQSPKRGGESEEGYNTAKKTPAKRIRHGTYAPVDSGKQWRTIATHRKKTN
jgi:hypothetical protein